MWGICECVEFLVFPRGITWSDPFLMYINEALTKHINIFITKLTESKAEVNNILDIKDILKNPPTINISAQQIICST
ncbi:hypothetical protein RCL_jg27383.t1 [Rhizophagus clarus]|uniref:Uncharacterized protein n=1 Tax=Rhizophagus clarus TaxID=94130 RepID=A0A8H3QWD6_9GLOM|nr:hypothetical protein RCL_jg27383.t1 [Rhizophagus clarus]